MHALGLQQQAHLMLQLQPHPALLLTQVQTAQAAG
jgi:hypothetical protein